MHIKYKLQTKLIAICKNSFKNNFEKIQAKMMFSLYLSLYIFTEKEYKSLFFLGYA